MNELHITSPDQLKTWLEGEFYFEEGFCKTSRLVTDELVSDGSSPSIEFELFYQIDGGWKAGESRTMRVHLCTAVDAVGNALPYNQELYLDEGVNVIEGDDGLGLDFRPYGSLVFRKLIVQHLPDRTIPVKVRMNPLEVSLRAGGGVPPTPQDWVDRFKRKEQDVVWRLYGGEECSAQQMSAERYAGFLQFRCDLGSTPGGIFVEVGQCDAAGFRIAMRSLNAQRDDSPDEQLLWRTVREFLVQFSDAQVATGNCVMTTRQWERFLCDGTLPDFGPQIS